MSETPMTPEQLAEIAARAAAATPGPWGFYDGDNYADVAADLEQTSRGSYSYREKVARLEDENYWDDPAHEDHDEERAPEQMAANAAFIAHAREDVPALLARVAELEAERHTTNEALSDAAEALRRQRNRITKLEARPAELAPLREAALHDLPTGTQWRVITTDSESLTGLAPACTADRRFHEIADYPGGPKYDDEGVYDCCPWPQVETYSVAVAAYLVALLNADAAKGGDAR